MVAIDDDNPFSTTNKSEKYVPWWMEDMELFLEALHGDIEEVAARFDPPQNISIKSLVRPRGQECPKCFTFFQHTGAGDDTCPFCLNKLGFSI